MQKLTFTSLVKKELLQKTLFKGTIKALLGASLLLAATLFLPPNLLNLFGLPIFLLGLLLISSGLIPYRKLKKQELHPNTLTLSLNTLEIHLQGKKPHLIPLPSIDHIEYIDQEPLFGILFFLNNPKTTLLIPYFSKRVYLELEEILFNSHLA